MNSFSKKTTFIKNSKSESYSFCLTDKNTIMCNSFNDKGEYIKSLDIGDQNILDYDADIDHENIIHLLCLTKEGNLTYYIYHDERWANHVLTKLDVKSNKYKHLILKIVKNKIHIFYSVSNLLNYNLYTIKHVVSDKRKWDKNNIISTTLGKNPHAFYVAFDKTGGIHLVYQDIDKGKQHIYYTSYNTFLKKWSKCPEKISDGNSDNYSPFLFIDNNNSIHVTWSTSVNNSTELMYKQMSVLSNSKHVWKQYKLPKCCNCSYPIIMQDNGVLKLLHNQNNILKCHYSNNHGYTWNTDESNANIDFESLEIIKFASNYTYDKLRMKVNYIYGKTKNKIELYYCSSYSNSLNVNSYEEDSTLYYDFNNSNDTNICSLKDEENQRILNSNLNQINKTKKEKYNTNTLDKENTIKTTHYNQYKENDLVDYNTEPLKNKDDFQSQDLNNLILEEIEKIENESVKEFIKNIKNKLDLLLSTTSILKEKSNEIEKIILSNVKELDKKFIKNKAFIDEIKNCLCSLEKTFDKYKRDNKEISELLSSIEEIYEQNTIHIVNIENKIQQIYDIVENTAAPNLLKKILSIFNK